MIAKLTGILDHIGPEGAVIDVGGVGYLVFGSNRTLGQLPPGGRRASSRPMTAKTTAASRLFDAAERVCGRLLTTVQGVGARLALAILSVVGPDEVTLAIVSQDRTTLARADGVGPKLAARIVNEPKDKVGNLALAATHSAVPAPVAGVAAGPTGDAVSALVNLGYRRAEAFGAVTAASRRLGDAATVDALIRAGLQELAQGASPAAAMGRAVNGWGAAITPELATRRARRRSGRRASPSLSASAVA